MEVIRWGVDTIIFAAIAGVGLAILIVSFVLGEIFDFFSHDVDVNIAGYDVISIGHDGEIPTAPPLLNTQTICAYITGFGATAWVLSGYFGVAPLSSGLWGLGGGLVLSIPAVFIYRALHKQGATSSFDLESVVGKEAVVSLGIPSIGLGRIQYDYGGSTHTTLARSSDGVEIPAGTAVRIGKVIGNEMYVRKSEKGG